MTWSSSFICADTMVAVLNATDSYKYGPASSPDQTNIALFNNSPAPTVQGPNVYLTSPWVTGDEINNGGGNWPAGGVALTTPTLATYSATGLQFYAGNVSESSVTLAGFYGCLAYRETSSSYYGMVAIYFGGSYTVTSGTIGITWQTVNSQTTLWYINLT